MVGPEGYNPLWDDIPTDHPGGHYNRQGEKISFRQWVQLIEENPEVRQVARTQVGPVWVSTVLVGLNMGIGADPPLIFETMSFSEPVWNEILQREVPVSIGEFVPESFNRYSTEDEALAGHVAACEAVERWVDFDMDKLLGVVPNEQVHGDERRGADAVPPGGDQPRAAAADLPVPAPGDGEQEAVPDVC